MTALKRGFTLIELLIVIAILGVLAVVVLVAINPVQQLARTRDAGRMSTIAQLGHAVEAYYAAHNGSYPTTFTDLTTSGEINSVPAVVTNSLNGPVCTAGTFNSNGWCVFVSNTAGDTIVFSRLEADVNLTLGTCTTDAYIAYDSKLGKACIVCTAPATSSDVLVCQN